MKKAFIITISFLSIIVLVMGVYLYSTTSTLASTTASLEGLYQRSFYELTNNVNNMEVEVSKLMVSNDSTSQQKILNNLKQQSSDAENSLSLLPLSNNVLEETTQFMNQLNGYCTSLITYNNGKIDSESYSTLSEVHRSLNSIKDELNKVMEKIMSGYKISDNLTRTDDGNNFSLNFSNFRNESINYPSLIYDGPFSESTTKKVVKGLPNETISQEEAEQKIQQIFGDNLTNLTLVSESAGTFETYDFGASTKDRNYFIQIAKRGGFLLTMSSNVQLSNNENSTPEQSELNSTDVEESQVATVEDINAKTNNLAIKSALEFAKNQNLKDMQSVWSASSEQVCYVNLAPVVDNIIMYPDIIKAKVDLSTNQVVGWEATSYAYNHVEREDLIPQLSESEAKKLVSDNLTVESQKLCVIPLDFVGETLAYEFAGKYDNYQYYLYIDAYTGSQVRVLRVIQTDQGELVL